MMSEVRKLKNMIQGHAEDGAGPRHASLFKLSITVQKARGLPKMDVLHGIDCYCVLSIEGMNEEVYQTHVVVKDRCVLRVCVCMHVYIMTDIGMYQRYVGVFAFIENIF